MLYSFHFRKLNQPDKISYQNWFESIILEACNNLKKLISLNLDLRKMSLSLHTTHFTLPTPQSVLSENLQSLFLPKQFWPPRTTLNIASIFARYQGMYHLIRTLFPWNSHKLQSPKLSKQACCAGCRRRPFPMQLNQ